MHLRSAEGGKTQNSQWVTESFSDSEGLALNPDRALGSGGFEITTKRVSKPRVEDASTWPIIHSAAARKRTFPIRGNDYAYKAVPLKYNKGS